MTGRPNRHSDEDILEVFTATDDGVLTTPEVRAAFDYSQVAIWRRLDKLAARGYLAERKTPQGSATIWKITSAGREIVEQPA